MKKSLILLFYILSSAFLMNAQDIVVESFKALPSDMTASSLDGKRIDQNGEVAALIKVVTTQQGFLFEGGSLGVVDTKQEQGEIWVWVPHGLRKITIKHQQLGVLRDYYFPLEINAERTYEMVLVAKHAEPEKFAEALPEQAVTPSSNVVYGSLNLESTPSFATIYIDGKEMGETPKYFADILIGDHEVRLTKAGYAVYKELVTIEKGERTQVKADLRMAPEGTIAGLFSVSATRQVYFSKGNLQYRASTKTWRFAENQWDYVGNANSSLMETYDAWIDLFGWGTSGYNHGAVCYLPCSKSASGRDYYAYGKRKYNLYDQDGKADWGYNAISNGGNVENNWRTLTSEEWVYVLQKRETPSGIRYVKAMVNNVNGVILLPDDWSSSYYSLNNVNEGREKFASNTISLTQWAVLEQHGAVFLPAAGIRHGTYVSLVGGYGDYWSSNSHFIDFNDSHLYADSRISFRFCGQSVRLVRSSE